MVDRQSTHADNSMLFIKQGMISQMSFRGIL